MIYKGNPDYSYDVFLIITVGNCLRGDDGIGSYIARRIYNSNYIVLDAGDKPENIIDKAIETNPSVTVIIDAAEFGGRTGEIRLFSIDSIPENTLSTHTFPIKAIGRLLMKETGSKVIFLGIQPKNVKLGENISDEVKASADEIVNLINNSSLERLFLN